MPRHFLSFNFKLSKHFFLLMLLPCTVNLHAQTIFRDDFDRANIGIAWQTNSWSIVNGSAFNNGGGTLRTTSTYTDSSYVIETAAKGFSNAYNRQFKITFGQANLSNDSTYVLIYTQYLGGGMTLGRSTDNVFYPEKLDQAAIYPDYNATQWYKFKIIHYKSGLIQVYVNTGSGYGTTPLLEAIDLEYPTLGHFGWQETTETAPEPFYVDYIQARKPVSEKPAIKEKPVEDNLIVQVSAKSGRAYNVNKLTNGTKAFTDRDYIITSVPSYLNGASFVQTAMEDKSNTADDFLTLFVKKDAIVYVAYDPRATSIPAWLNQFTKTGDIIGTTDPGSSYLEIYSRLIEPWEIYPRPLILGGNLASPANGAKMNYLVAAIERPNLQSYQAEDALLSGAVVANDHPGYIGTGFADYKNASNDYIEWTVTINVPGTYSINFGFANGSDAARPLQISDNGISIGVLSFIPIGSWNSWAFVSGPNVFLSPGIHKIRATAIGSSGPNIDQLSLYYLSSAPVLKVTASRDLKPAELIKKSFSHKVYPNPFVTSTKIFYTLKEKSNVVLSVYSLQGQQIQLLVNGVKNAGEYEATFNAGKLSSGTYLYRLQIGKDVQTGKLLKQ